MFLGVPYNIFEYGVLSHMFAKLVWGGERELRVYIAEGHIYDNHIEQVNEQLKRHYRYPFPRVSIAGNQKSIDDFNIEDFDIQGYYPLARIKASVAV